MDKGDRRKQGQRHRHLSLPPRQSLGGGRAATCRCVPHLSRGVGGGKLSMKGRPSGERGAHLLPFAAEDGHRTAAPPQRLLGITHARKTPKNSCVIDCTVKRIQAP